MGQLSVDLSAKMEVLKTKTSKRPRPGVAFPRYFTARLEAGQNPLRRGRNGRSAPPPSATTKAR